MLTCAGEGWLTLCIGCARYRKDGAARRYKAAADGVSPCAGYDPIFKTT